jgi:hypothetical protein
MFVFVGLWVLFLITNTLEYFDMCFFRWSASVWWLLLLSFVIRTYNLEESYYRHFVVSALKQHVVVYNDVCYLVIYRSQRARLQLCITYCRQSET